MASCERSVSLSRSPHCQSRPSTLLPLCALVENFFSFLSPQFVHIRMCVCSGKNYPRALIYYPLYTSLTIHLVGPKDCEGGKIETLSPPRALADESISNSIFISSSRSFGGMKEYVLQKKNLFSLLKKKKKEVKKVRIADNHLCVRVCFSLALRRMCLEQKWKLPVCHLGGGGGGWIDLTCRLTFHLAALSRRAHKYPTISLSCSLSLTHSRGGGGGAPGGECGTGKSQPKRSRSD